MSSLGDAGHTLPSPPLALVLALPPLLRHIRQALPPPLQSVPKVLQLDLSKDTAD